MASPAIILWSDFEWRYPDVSQISTICRSWLEVGSIASRY